MNIFPVRWSARAQCGAEHEKMHQRFQVVGVLQDVDLHDDDGKAHRHADVQIADHSYKEGHRFEERS